MQYVRSYDDGPAPASLFIQDPRDLLRAIALGKINEEQFVALMKKERSAALMNLRNIGCDFLPEKPTMRRVFGGVVVSIPHNAADVLRTKITRHKMTGVEVRDS